MDHLRRWWPLYAVVIVVTTILAYFSGCFSYHKKPEVPLATINSEYVDVMYPANQVELLNANRLVKDQNGKIIGITFDALQELLQNALAQKIKDDSSLQDLLRGPQGEPGSYQVVGSGARGPRGAAGPKGERGERGSTGIQGPQGPTGKVDSNVASELVEQYLKSSAGQQMIANFVAKSVKTTTTKQSSQKIRVPVPQTLTIEVERVNNDD